MRILKSKIFWIILVVVLLGMGATAFVLRSKADAPSRSQSNEVADNAESLVSDPNTIRMLATGDFIAHDAINLRAKMSDGTYDYMQFMAGMEPYFKEADIRFCNQATVAGGEAFGITGYPVFNAPFEWIRDMAKLGCNVINTGTNHTNDKGQGPITAQANEWDQQADILAVAGANRSAAEQNAVRYFEVKGVKFAFLSYSTYSNSPNPNPYSLNRFTEPLVTNQMAEARGRADIVIVSMRWGTEYSETINAAQSEQSQKLADLGADIILGHGTHTLQPVKRLAGKDGRETIVWYGLGNFLNAQLETTGLTGCVAQFAVDVPSKKLSDSTCLPFYMHYEWSLEEKAREDLLKRRNFQILPLYKAEQLLSQSQLDTTVETQMSRIQQLINQFTKILVLNSDGL